MNPEVYLLVREEAKMAILREYDTALSEPPYAITVEGDMSIIVREVPQHRVDIWFLCDSALSAWAARLPDDEWRQCTAVCYFKHGRAVVPFEICRGNAKGFSLLHAFCEMAFDGHSPSKT